MTIESENAALRARVEALEGAIRELLPLLRHEHGGTDLGAVNRFKKRPSALHFASDLIALWDAMIAAEAILAGGTAAQESAGALES